MRDHDNFNQNDGYSAKDELRCQEAGSEFTQNTRTEETRNSRARWKIGRVTIKRPRDPLGSAKLR